MRFSDNPEAVCKILMVGAQLEAAATRELTLLDTFYLAQTLLAMSGMGIPVRENVEISICNLLYDHDFLDDRIAVACDLLVLSNLFFDPGDIDTAHPNRRQSMYAGIPECWTESFRRTRARYVVRIHDDDYGAFPRELIETANVMQVRSWKLPEMQFYYADLFTKKPQP